MNRRNDIRVKKAIAGLLAGIMLLMLIGCASVKEKEQTVQESAQTTQSAATQTEKTPEPAQPDGSELSESAAPETEPAAERSSDILVVYFSRTGEQYNVGVIEKGNTAIVAEIIAEATGADLWEILPEPDTYPTAYSELTDVAKREQNENARPTYAGTVPDLSQYTTVFIGAPVWWGDWPMILYTFFENNRDALSGKTLIPFSTHEGSGLSGFDKKLAKSVPDASVAKGLAIRGSDCQNRQDSVRETITDWLKGLGY